MAVAAKNAAKSKTSGKKTGMAAPAKKAKAPAFDVASFTGEDILYAVAEEVVDFARDDAECTPDVYAIEADEDGYAGEDFEELGTDELLGVYLGYPKRPHDPEMIVGRLSSRRRHPTSQPAN